VRANLIPEYAGAAGIETTFSVDHVDQFRACCSISTTKPSTLPRKWRKKIIAGMAITKPNAVLYNATEMPWASSWGLDPVGDWELKISIMPTTVRTDHQRLIVAMVPSVVKKRSSSLCHRAAALRSRPHDIARTLVVAEARSKYLTERRILRELLEHVLTHALLLVCSEHLLQQAARNDLLFAEDQEPFDDERYCDDRHGEKEIDGPAGSLDDANNSALRVRRRTL